MAVKIHGYFFDTEAQICTDFFEIICVNLRNCGLLKILS